jgi:hypothetical protein
MAHPYQPNAANAHTSMWLDDPYGMGNGAQSQLDSGFNSRPASLRSLESADPVAMHHGPPIYESMPPPPMTNGHEHSFPEYVEMQSVPAPRPDPAHMINELLGLLIEEDPVIVREAILVIQLLVKEGGDSRSEVIRHRQVRMRTVELSSLNIFI